MSETDGQRAASTPVAGLAAARRIQNLSVADAARQLKLSVRQIEALEAGEFEKLPGPVFVRGFLRNYSRLLGLDPEQVLRSVAPVLPSPPQQAELPPSEEIPFPPTKATRWPKYALVTLILAGGVIAYEFYADDPMSMVMKSGRLTNAANTAPPPPGPVAAPASVSVERVQSANDPLSPVPVSGISTMAQDADTVDARVESSEIPAAPADADQPPLPVERQVRLSFDKTSWVEIRDRFGKIIFSQLNPPGTERSLYGRPPLSLVIGNAHGVHVTYDDNPVDLQQYTKVDVARLTLE